ncbi:MAG: transcriptional regulator [Ruminococcaceae bacterium]|nr:transcriptional regulator [Oscillospiraceae bacterium]
MGLNDNAWSLLFNKYKIIDKIEKSGSFIITADQIREFREPRLMTKFDHKANLPKLFAENNLSILPISRGEYIISSFSAYKEFDEPTKLIERVSIPEYIQSLMPDFIFSETIALNCAKACGILSDFLEDEAIVSTVSGRMGSGNFDFNIQTKTGIKSICVNNSQIEIDAAYEGVEYLSLFEAKRELSNDFLIRQLYYPYRTWENKVNKQVKTVFLVFTNGVFYLYQYKFDDPKDYNSLRLVKQKNYIISTQINLSDVEHILKTTNTIEEPDIAFPQANNMSRIINLLELLYEKSLSKEDITAEYLFDERQTNYYTDACRYLSLIDKDISDGINFEISDYGKYIFSQSYKQRQLLIVKQILKHKVFSEVLKLHLQSGEMPNMKTIVNIMKNSNLYNVKSDSTYERRASTVSGWVNWILSIIED